MPKSISLTTLANSFIGLTFFAFFVPITLSRPVTSVQDNQILFSGDCSRPLTGVPSTSGIDADSDGISDSCEQTLAERFAPIVYHSSDESNFPTNVDWFLSKTELWLYTAQKSRRLIVKPSQAQLLGLEESDGQVPPQNIKSSGTWSKGKRTTFFLKDVDDKFRIGSTDSKEWTTYYHAYPNDESGITIQYWRFYAYNDAANNHGGDWEGIHIILNSGLRPLKIALLGHTAIHWAPFSDAQKEGEHAIIFSEGGGHGSRLSGDGIQAKGCGGLLGNVLCTIKLDKPATFVRQETWTNGNVQWFNDKKGRTGLLLNVGEKSKPMNGQIFLQYSGIWGSPSEFPLSPTFYPFSGYWGPAFNETGRRDDGFVTAWCAGRFISTRDECFPESIAP